MSLIERAGALLEGRSGPRPANPPPEAREAREIRVTRETREAEPRTPAAGVVTIDLDRQERAGLLSPRKPATPLAEQLRRIKRALLARAFAPGHGRDAARLIMVTSAGVGEGKTFTAINLAISLSFEKDIQVLLADADVVRPSVAGRLGVTDAMIGGHGLLDLLENPGLALEQAILATNIDKLSLLPPGARRDVATELLGSERMTALAARLVRRHPHQFVVFDAPPVLAASEALAVAGHVGQIVFVVEAGRTGEGSIRAALQALGDRDDISLVLNKAAPRPSHGYYAAR